MASPTVLALAAVFCAFFVRYLLQRRKERRKALPPGPPGYPLIGNVLELPTSQEWLTYAKWGKQYGDLVYLEAMGQPIVIVNTLDAAFEIFERRSSKFSDRPDMLLANDLMGQTWNFGFMRYGDRWREHRKMFHAHYQPKAVEKYTPIQIRSARQMLDALLQTPEEFMDHIAFFTGYIILNNTYGYRPKDRQDYYVRLSELAQELLNEVTHQTWMVEIFPILKNLPLWAPGAHILRYAKNARAVNASVLKEPYDRAREDLAKGNPDPSFIQDQLAVLQDINDPAKFKETEQLVQNTAAVAYFAGADTVTTAISTFLLAMILHPECQKKAQKELDDLLGGQRLPEFTDREHLPYLRALLMETLRWNPVTPLGIPHRSSADDVYNGKLIPKDTIIMGNAWAIFHDEKLYGPDVMDFNPERFMPQDGKPMPPDPVVAAFGYGRRICPGRHIAQNNLWIAMTSILTTFDLRKGLDENGKEIEPTVHFASGVVSKPAPFKCRFIPRSEDARKLVMMEA